MKTVAIFLLLTFAGTILITLAMSLTQQNQVSFFIVDEKKISDANQLNEIKEKKNEYSNLFPLYLAPTEKDANLLSADGRCSLLPTSPNLEYVAPPPNVC